MKINLEVGIRGPMTKGLTDLGKEIVEKLVKKNIAIDLSHANEKTFNDIIYQCENLKEYNPIVFASHSNCREICDIKRNFTNNQLLKIKKFNRSCWFGIN
jgi:membrane dipeptidase